MTMVEDSRGRSTGVKSRPAITRMPMVWKYPGSTTLAETGSCGPPDSETHSVPDGISGSAEVREALTTPGSARRRSSAWVWSCRLASAVAADGK